MDLTRYIFIDGHCHPLSRRQMELDGLAMRQCFTESRSRKVMTEFVPESLHYTDMINRAGELFGINGEGELLSFRSNQDRTEYVRTLLDEMSFGALIVDGGFSPEEMMPPSQMASITGRPVFDCRRIETVLESAIMDSDSFANCLEQFATQLFVEAAGGGGIPVALKTIAGYRGGLDIKMCSVSDAESDYANVKRRFMAEPASRRIERCPFYHYCLMQAFELAACHNIPVQIHTGLGDDDADLVSVNPALLQPLFRSSTLHHTNFVLLHCYPYVREAAIMSALYPNVYMDLSLAINLVSPRATDLILEALACAPSSKILAGSDGHTSVESLWYGAYCWKRGLSVAMDKLVDEGFLSIAQAQQVAANILHGNAIRLYNLEGLI